MSTRRASSLIVLSLAVATAIGCSRPPSAPSGVEPAQPGDQTMLASAAPGQTAAATPLRFGDRTPGVVYVTSQGLYYDTFVVKDPLPMKGRFQQLANGQTEFGPGQPGYLGGRWWEDLDGNGVQDPDDHYFLCPLLPPGRSTP